MLPRGADATPRGQRHGVDRLHTHRPDAVARGSMQAASRVEREDFGGRPDEFPDRHASAVGEADQGVAGHALSKVRQHRPLVRAALQGAAELTQRDHRNVQLLGQGLQAAADLADLLLAIVRAGGGARELQVVHHHHVEALLRLQPAALGAHLEHGDGGGVVDVDRRLGQLPRRLGEQRPVRVLQVAGAELVRVDARLGREQALHELLLAHLQREEGDALLLLDRRVLRDVEHEARLAHGRAPRHDQQIRRLQPAREAVQALVARGHAGDVGLAVVDALDVLEGGLEDLVHGLEALAQASLAHGQDRRLGAIEDVHGVVPRVEAALDDLAADLDHPPQRRLLGDDPRVVLDVRPGRHALLQPAKIAGAARALEAALPAQLLGKRDDVHRLAALEEVHHGGEDRRVLRGVEVVGLQQLDGLEDGIAIEQQRAEDRLLGLEVLRRHARIARGTGRAVRTGVHSFLYSSRMFLKSSQAGRFQLGLRSSAAGWKVA